MVEVYALGAMLYEVLTGQLPFTGGVIRDLFTRILNEKPKPPRRLVRSIPAALEAICLKAMAKDRATDTPRRANWPWHFGDFLASARRKGFWKSS